MIEAHPASEERVESASHQGPASTRTGMFYALAIAGIMLVAILLRAGGAGFGLPHLYHWDEKMYFHGAFYAWATGGSTESLVYGNVPYLILPILWIVALFQGASLQLPKVITSYLSDPTPFYLAGRLTWVGLQALAVYGCYRVAARTLSRRAGLLAAFFLAAAFLSVSEGHYVKGDSTAMLGALLAAAAALALVRRPTNGWYLALGGAIGLSLAFKPYTYPLVLVPVLAHFLAWSGWGPSLRQWWRLLLSAVGAIVCFLVTLPAPLVDPAGTWNTFKIESAIQLASVPTGGQPIWLYYWTGHLLEGTGWPLELAGLCGFAIWAVRRDRQRLILLVMPLLLWLGIVSRSNGFARYALPIVPFLCLAAADALDLLAARFASRFKSARFTAAVMPAALALAGLLLALPSLLNDVRFDAYTSAPDTRTQAAQWVEAHIPAGATVVEEGGQGFEAMSTLGPPLRASTVAVGQTWSPTSLKPPSDFWTQPLLRWLDTYTPTYRLTFAPTLTRRAEITSTAQWGDPDAFVMIGWRSDPEHDRPPSPFWDDLHRKYTLAARFDCSPCMPDDPYAWAVDYETLSEVNLFSRTTAGGPTVWVYRRK